MVLEAVQGLMPSGFNLIRRSGEVKQIGAALLVAGGMVIGASFAWFGLAMQGNPDLPESLRLPTAETPSSQPALALVNPVPQPEENTKPMLKAAAQKRPLPAPEKTGYQDSPVPKSNSPRGAIAKTIGGARLAVVIDDIGNNLSRARQFAALTAPITFSVIPGLASSRKSADVARAAGREYIIHLPMEPFDFPKQNPGPNALLLKQSKQSVRNRMNQYLKELPHAVGASNHMGSAYTYDTVRMSVVQEMVSQRKLFFLNSRTSSSPVPGSIARRKGYAYLERDVFLDNKVTEPAIRKQLHRAFQLARKNGSAVAIGHPHRATYQVLAKELSASRLKDINIVPLSDLLTK